MIYQCTYRGCGEQHITVRSIEAHVRKEHLLKEDPDKFLEEGEEEFYYTEVSHLFAFYKKPTFDASKNVIRRHEYSRGL